MVLFAAFEVSYADTVVFSKLDSGRMPSLAEVVAAIGEAMAAAAGSN